MNMKRGMVIFLVGFLAVASVADAQERPFPYSVSQSDLLILPGGLLLSQWGTWEAEAFREPLTREDITNFKRSDINRFDRSATSNWSSKWGDRSDEYRDKVIIATIGIGMYETVRSRNLEETATMGVMFLEAALLVKGTTYLVKGLAGRKRPFVYNTSLSVEDRYREAVGDENDVFHSFFSGHAAAAFALATFTSTVFSDIHGPSAWSSIVWGSTLTCAVMTAYARVKAGVHYPSDVIAGALVGGAIGHLVPVLHRRNASQRLNFGVLPDRVYLTLGF
ncbi:phosphatase PAP2 family protein [Candidatus Zixiibacteriota bacterium]